MFFAGALANFAVCALSIANRIKIEVRDEPVFPRDFALVREVGSAMQTFDINYPVTAIALVLLTTAALVVLGVFITSRPVSFAVLKARNMYYGYDSSAGKYTYSESDLGGPAVGCYHIQIPGSYVSYSNAAADAQLYGGFVAWIDGAYQVRVGSYATKETAESALTGLPQGTVVGTSAYGMNVVEICIPFDPVEVVLGESSIKIGEVSRK